MGAGAPACGAARDWMLAAIASLKDGVADRRERAVASKVVCLSRHDATLTDRT